MIVLVLMRFLQEGAAFCHCCRCRTRALGGGLATATGQQGGGSGRRDDGFHGFNRGGGSGTDAKEVVGLKIRQSSQVLSPIFSSIQLLHNALHKESVKKMFLEEIV